MNFPVDGFICAGTRNMAGEQQDGARNSGGVSTGAGGVCLATANVNTGTGECLRLTFGNALVFREHLPCPRVHANDNP